MPGKKPEGHIHLYSFSFCFSFTITSLCDVLLHLAYLSADLSSHVFSMLFMCIFVQFCFLVVIHCFSILFVLSLLGFNV